MSAANKCEACERASAAVAGGKCALHESSTSPIVHRVPPTYGPTGAIGEPCRLLMGWALRPSGWRSWGI